MPHVTAAAGAPVAQVSGRLLNAYRMLAGAEAGHASPLDSGAAQAVEDAWLRGQSYDPVFEYRPPTGPAVPGARVASGFDDVLEQAHRATQKLGDWTLAAFTEFLAEQREWGAALASHCPERITAVSLAHNGPVDPRDVADARALLAGGEANELEPEPVLPAAAAAGLLEELLQQFGWRQWHAVVEPMVARMAVSGQRQVVRLNAQAWFGRAELRRLAVHEVGCHVARSAAGQLQRKPLLALGICPRHMLAEEGLAVWLEGELGVLAPRDVRKYALRVVATDTALRAGFGATYAQVRPHVDAESAFTIVRRVKRGLADTGAAGAYAKDHVYWAGRRQVGEAVGREPDVTRVLACGKVSLERLEPVRADVRDGELDAGADLVVQARELLALLDGLLDQVPAPAWRR